MKKGSESAIAIVGCVDDQSQLPNLSKKQMTTVLFDYVKSSVQEFEDIHRQHGRLPQEQLKVRFECTREDQYRRSIAKIDRSQEEVGDVIAAELLEIITASPNASQLKFFEFILLVPNRNSLYDQTVGRLKDANLTEVATVFKVQKEAYDVSNKIGKDFHALKKCIASRQDTAFIFLHDEAHWGMTR
jgi:hypothetical protein